MNTADVVIVGGGIVGSAAAYFLSTDAGFRGRRILIVERDPSYREGSTARSAGGLRQQFSTPENIAMSQFTLSMFRRLAAIFGADADVGFREQGYLIMAPAEGRGAAGENVALQQSMGADIALLGRSELDARFPWLASEGVAAAASASAARAGSTRRASPICSARRPSPTAPPSSATGSLASAAYGAGVWSAWRSQTEAALPAGRW